MTTDQIGKAIIDAILDGGLMQVTCRPDKTEPCGRYPYCFVAANAAEQVGVLARDLVGQLGPAGEPPTPIG